VLASVDQRLSEFIDVRLFWEGKVVTRSDLVDYLGSACPSLCDMTQDQKESKHNAIYDKNNKTYSRGRGSRPSSSSRFFFLAAPIFSPAVSDDRRRLLRKRGVGDPALRPTRSCPHSAAHIEPENPPPIYPRDPDPTFGPHLLPSVKRPEPKPRWISRRTHWF